MNLKFFNSKYRNNNQFLELYHLNKQSQIDSSHKIIIDRFIASNNHILDSSQKIITN